MTTYQVNEPQTAAQPLCTMRNKTGQYYFPIHVNAGLLFRLHLTHLVKDLLASRACGHASYVKH